MGISLSFSSFLSTRVTLASWVGVGSLGPLRARIHESYRKKVALIGEIGSLETRLENELDGEDYDKINRLSHAAAEKTHIL